MRKCGRFDPPITVCYREHYYWNGFWGFFFLPVGPHRTKERIVKEGTALYDTCDDWRAIHEREADQTPASTVWLTSPGV